MRLVILFTAVVLFAGQASAACNKQTPSPVFSVALPGHPFGIVLSTGNHHVGCWLFVSLDNGAIAVLRRNNGRVVSK